MEGGESQDRLEQLEHQAAEDCQDQQEIQDLQELMDNQADPVPKETQAVLVPVATMVNQDQVVHRETQEHEDHLVMMVTTEIPEMTEHQVTRDPLVFQDQLAPRADQEMTVAKDPQDHLAQKDQREEMDRQESLVDQASPEPQGDKDRLAIADLPVKMAKMAMMAVPDRMASVESQALADPLEALDNLDPGDLVETREREEISDLKARPVSMD